VSERDIRVPMAPDIAKNWFDNGDAQATIRDAQPRVGRRISFILSESAIAQMGAQAAAYAVEELGKGIVHRSQDKIQMAVDEVLMDRDLIQSMVLEVAREIATRMALEMFDPDQEQ